MGRSTKNMTAKQHTILPSTTKLRAFRRIVLQYYAKEGRHFLPWRKTQDPYHIVVSEVMLQQTQALRVVPYFEKFISRFRTIEQLAAAKQSDVLGMWQGLGYNRRARSLHQLAIAVSKTMHGEIPRTYDSLLGLPGIGPYTANAIMVFAYNKKRIVIETNIRTVYLHHFFPGQSKVSDEALSVVIEATLPKRNFRGWYSALMDYGAMLKIRHGNVSRNSKVYVKQSPFKGSSRSLRGCIIRTLVKDSQSLRKLKAQCGNDERTGKILDDLCREGLIEKEKGLYTLS